MCPFSQDSIKDLRCFNFDQSFPSNLLVLYGIFCFLFNPQNGHYFYFLMTTFAYRLSMWFFFNLHTIFLPSYLPTGIILFNIKYIRQWLLLLNALGFYFCYSKIIFFHINYCLVI